MTDHPDRPDRPEEGAAAASPSDLADAGGLPPAVWVSGLIVLTALLLAAFALI